jgi:CheY-like chemotaxis protein
MSSAPSTIRILYVDPNRDFREEIAALLEQEDEQLTVVQVDEAEAAKSRLREDAFDCVVSEYTLPTSDGLALLDHVHRDGEEIPFLLFTDSGSEELASEAISAGVTDYVPKKPDFPQHTLLANRIVNSVTQHRAHRQALEAEQRLQTLTEATSDVLWMFTPDWSEVLFVNSVYEEVWRRSVEALIEDPSDLMEECTPRIATKCRRRWNVWRGARLLRWSAGSTPRRISSDGCGCRSSPSTTMPAI